MGAGARARTRAGVLTAAATTPAPAATAASASVQSTPLFHGAPAAIMLGAGEVGPGWTVYESHQDAPNQYSSGQLSSTLQSNAQSAGMAVSVEVFRDIATAIAGWKLDSSAFQGGPVPGCDDGWQWVYPGATTLNCRVANVELRITAASTDLTRAALAPMLSRTRAGLQ